MLHNGWEKGEVDFLDQSKSPDFRFDSSIISCLCLYRVGNLQCRDKLWTKLQVHVDTLLNSIIKLKMQKGIIYLHP